MRLAGIVTLLLFLAGCVDGRLQREAFAVRFVGQPEAVLVRELGVPQRTLDTDGRRFLAYVQRTQYFRPTAYATPWRWGYPTIVGESELVDLVCETTFEVAGGLVVEAKVRGNGCD